MEQLISILKHTQGVFLSPYNNENAMTSDLRKNIVYIGISADKHNIRDDIRNVVTDFHNSYDAARQISF